MSANLLEKFKKSIGDFGSGMPDDYYMNFLTMAKADLLSDDISEEQLDSELGVALTVIYAEQLMNKADIANINLILIIYLLLVIKNLF